MLAKLLEHKLRCLPCTSVVIEKLSCNRNMRVITVWKVIQNGYESCMSNCKDKYLKCTHSINRFLKHS